MVTQGIGARIRAMRTEQKLTLAELAERCSLSTSYLSQVERDKTTPSLPTLTAIAGALNVHPRTFFEVASETAYVVRLEDRNGGKEQPEHLLTPNGASRLILKHVQTPAGESSGFLPTYSGEELLFVLSGQLRVDIGDECFTLTQGDSLHYDAAQPHMWTNEGREACAFIWSRVAGPLER